MESGLGTGKSWKINQMTAAFLTGLFPTFMYINLPDISARLTMYLFCLFMFTIVSWNMLVITHKVIDLLKVYKNLTC